MRDTLKRVWHLSYFFCTIHEPPHFPNESIISCPGNICIIILLFVLFVAATSAGDKLLATFALRFVFLWFIEGELDKTPRNRGKRIFMPPLSLSLSTDNGMRDVVANFDYKYGNYIFLYSLSAISDSSGTHTQIEVKV